MVVGDRSRDEDAPAWLPILASNLPEVRLFDQLELAAAILGRILPLVRLGADQSPHRVAVAEINELERHDFINDAGQFLAGLAAVNLQLPRRDVKFVLEIFQDTDEEHVLAAAMLQMRQPRDHLATEQSVNAKKVFLAAIVQSLRLLLAPAKAKPRGNRNAIDEVC